MTEPSEKYFEAVRLGKNHHKAQTKTWSGRFTWKSRHRIKELIDQYGVVSILDYGVGKGRQYEDIDPDTGQNLEQYWGIKTTKYDPCVSYFDKEPTGKFDMVICVQVLGSIPRDDLSWVVDRLYGFATKVIFVAERLIIPRKQIYASMVEDMPFGMSREEWHDLLRRPRFTRVTLLEDTEDITVTRKEITITRESPKMFFAAKGDGFGWTVEEIK